MSDNNKAITSASQIVNAFNIYFSKVVLKIQSSIKYPTKAFYEFFPPLHIHSFFLSPTDNNEISFIIYALQSQKVSRHNSIPIKISELMKKIKSNENVQIIALFFFYLPLIKSWKG